MKSENKGRERMNERCAKSVGKGEVGALGSKCQPAHMSPPV